MLWSNYSDIISHLKQNYRQRKFEHTNNPAKRSKLNAEARGLLQLIIAELNPESPTYRIPDDWTETRLLNNVTELLIYRECLGKAKIAQDQYENNYAQFLKNNPEYYEAIQRRNPFVINEHLIHICNILERYKQMQSGKQANNNEITNYITTYHTMLEELKVTISNLDKDKLGDYKDYLQALICYTLAVSYTEVPAVRNPDIGKLYLEESFISAKIGSAIETATSARASPNTFARTSTYSRASIESKQENENENDKAAKAPLSFYACNKSAFSRLPIASFSQLQTHIIKTGIFTAKECGFMLNKAAERQKEGVAKRLPSVAKLEQKRHRR